MNQKLYDLIEANPVIAAVKDMEGLDACCKRDEIKVVFILFGDICNISAIVGQIKESDKVAMVHIDLITGLSSKEVAVDLSGIIPARTESFQQSRPDKAGKGAVPVYHAEGFCTGFHGI